MNEPKSAKAGSQGRAAKRLGSIIGQLEAWQRMYGEFDSGRWSAAAKKDLMYLLSKLEDTGKGK